MNRERERETLNNDEELRVWKYLIHFDEDVIEGVGVMSCVALAKIRYEFMQLEKFLRVKKECFYWRFKVIDCWSPGTMFIVYHFPICCPYLLASSLDAPDYKCTVLNVDYFVKYFTADTGVAWALSDGEGDRLSCMPVGDIAQAASWLLPRFFESCLWIQSLSLFLLCTIICWSILMTAPDLRPSFPSERFRLTISPFPPSWWLPFFIAAPWGVVALRCASAGA